MTYNNDVLNKIQKLIEIANKEQSCNKIEDTFLNVIGRNYHETYISKILMYVLKNDNNLLVQLISKYQFEKNKKWIIDFSKLHIIESCLEKSMGNFGRVDVFIVASDSENDKSSENKIIFVLENKSLTWEHDDQTQKYYDFVEKQKEYKETKKVYIFLKPDFNNSEPSCKEYISVKYSELINNDNCVNQNYIINDFNKHIRGYLTEMTITEAEKYYFNNYMQFKEIIDSSNKKFDEIKQDLMIYLKKNFDYKGLKIVYQPYESKNTKNAVDVANALVMWKEHNDTVFHLYRNKVWYSEDFEENYYFYVEVKFEDNNPNSIVCQSIVRTTRNEDSLVNRFLNEVAIKYYSDWGKYRWSVLEKEHFDSENELFSQEWLKELNEWTCSTLKDLFSKMNNIVNEYFKCK